jgi:hypothetical protein
MKKVVLFGFICGALAVVVFMHGTAFLLHHHGAKVPMLVETLGRFGQPFNFTPQPPFGLPVLAHQVFWGGVWGVVLAAVLRGSNGPDLLTGLIFGAAIVTFVGFAIFAYNNGMPLAGASRAPWFRAALLNGAWGFGTAFLLRPFQIQPKR